MAIQTVVLNTITDDSEKAHPQGFELALNNSVLTKNNSGNWNWINVTDGKMLYGSPTGIILITVLKSTDVFVSDDNHLLTSKIFNDNTFFEINDDGSRKDAVVFNSSGVNTLNPNKSFLFCAESNSGTNFYENPNPGTDRKVMFYDQVTGAFRLGEANLEFDNVGNDSFAIGNRNTVEGAENHVIGADNNILTIKTNVFGDKNESITRYATILGTQANAVRSGQVVKSYRGEWLAVGYTDSSAYRDLWIDEAGNIAGMQIDTTKKGWISLFANVQTLKDDWGEWEVDEVVGTYRWDAGGSIVGVATNQRQIYRSGTNRAYRFVSNSISGNWNEIKMQVDGNATADHIYTMAHVSFTIMYED